MPKYKPTEQDLWDTRSCPMCGRDILDFGAETCSDECRWQLESYKDDMEWMLLQEWEALDK